MTAWIRQNETALRFFLPAGIAAGIALVCFVVVGHTPWIRALGLAAVIGAMTLTLRRLSAPLALLGSLALAFSPAFWSQTGGSPSGTPIMALVLFGAIASGLILRQYGVRGFLLLEIGVLMLSLVFWREFTYYKSLRITTLCAALLLYAIIDGLLRSNPRPDEGPPAPVDPLHTLGALLLLTVGTINEPLFALFMPAVALGLWLTRSPLAWWYWVFFALVAGIGGYRITTDYIDPQWWNTPMVQLEGVQAPYLVADGWREPTRWLLLIDLVVGQFSPLGVALAVMGLARLARWYPPLGTTTVVAYVTYGLFGLMYLGRDNAVLLLPLLMLQVIWMTYAMYALGQWLQKGFTRHRLRWATVVMFAALPLLLLVRVIAAN